MRISDWSSDVCSSDLGDYMSSPVQSLPMDAMIYRALGRMDRLGIRHLAVVDAAGHAVGIVTARGLLRQRAGTALAIGEELAVAPDAAAMAAVREQLPRSAESRVGTEWGRTGKLRW